MANLERLPRDIDRYMLLSALQERNERLFYQTVIEHIDRIMPLIYTPTVGEACKEFSHIARDPKGFFITPDDRGKIAPHPRQLAQARTSASSSSPTDSASWGLAISAPTAWASRSASSRSTPPARASIPKACLPVTLDVGTNNEELLQRRAVSRVPAQAAEGQARTSISSRSSSTPCSRDIRTR